MDVVLKSTFCFVVHVCILLVTEMLVNILSICTDEELEDEEEKRE